MPEVWFQMAKIGLLVSTQAIKERIIRNKEQCFNNKKYIGFNHIISEIDKSHNIKYISSIEEELNSVDYVLYSITSWYDILNLINELRNKKIKSKIIVGGAGLLNFSLLSKYIDIAVLGRGEGIINELIDGKLFNHVWTKSNDKEIENIYEIGEAKTLINNERAVGCKFKCYFCQYGWKNHYFGSSKNYDSGLNSFEDNLKYLDWNITANCLITAIDGQTEKSRKIVNKNMTDKDIENKILSFYEEFKGLKKSIKIYCIVGYPFENDIDDAIINIIKKCDKKSNKILNIFLSSTHFCPMPMTPMENENVNLINFRKKIIDRKYVFSGKTIKLWWLGNQCTSPLSALEECILFRSDKTHLELIEKIFLSKKYLNLNGFNKIKVIQEYFPKYLWAENKSEKIIPYIQYPKGFYSAKNRYYKLKQEYA